MDIYNHLRIARTCLQQRLVCGFEVPNLRKPFWLTLQLNNWGGVGCHWIINEPNQVKLQSLIRMKKWLMHEGINACTMINKYMYAVCVYKRVHRHKHCCYINPKVDLRTIGPRYSATNSFTTSSAPILSWQCAAPPTCYVAWGDKAWFINSFANWAYCKPPEPPPVPSQRARSSHTFNSHTISSCGTPKTTHLTPF